MTIMNKECRWLLLTVAFCLIQGCSQLRSADPEKPDTEARLALCVKIMQSGMTLPPCGGPPYGAACAVEARSHKLPTPVKAPEYGCSWVKVELYLKDIVSRNPDQGLTVVENGTLYLLRQWYIWGPGAPHDRPAADEHQAYFTKEIDKRRKSCEIRFPSNMRTYEHTLDQREFLVSVIATFARDMNSKRDGSGLYLQFLSMRGL